MKLVAPFIKLPFTFDPTKLYQEVMRIPKAEWQPHPGKHKGNYAIPLITVDGGMNDKFAGRMMPTSYLKSMPYVEQVISSFGEVVSRARIMIIEGKQSLPMHTDINYHWYSRVRIHIPIITNPLVEFTCKTHKAHMPAGEAWLLDTWHSHQVINNSDETRIHLVFDTAGSSKFWNLVDKSEKPTLKDDESRLEIQHIPYEQNKQVQLLTEQFNVHGVMSPGEVDGLIVDILNDATQHTQNQQRDLEQFITVANNFRWDWRQIYSVYGSEQSAWQKYQQLIQQAMKLIQTISTPLYLKSNNANAVNTLCARVLWPAFNQEMAKQNR